LHKQVWIKVNAPIDEGIAELIEALSSFPMLQTIESCQGDAAEPVSGEEGQPAKIFFYYGQHDHAHPYRDIAEFVLGYLGPELMGDLGDRVSVQLDVVTEYIVMGILTVRQGAMRRTIRAIRRLRRNFKG
jgi:hypothetical protein